MNGGHAGLLPLVSKSGRPRGRPRRLRNRRQGRAVPDERAMLSTTRSAHCVACMVCPRSDVRQQDHAPFRAIPGHVGFVLLEYVRPAVGILRSRSSRSFLRSQTEPRATLMKIPFRPERFQHFRIDQVLRFRPAGRDRHQDVAGARHADEGRKVGIEASLAAGGRDRRSSCRRPRAPRDRPPDLAEARGCRACAAAQRGRQRKNAPFSHLPSRTKRSACGICLTAHRISPWSYRPPRRSGRPACW